MKKAVILATLLIVPACRTPSGTEGTASSVKGSEDADLADDLAFINADAKKMVETSRQKLGAPANRDFHSKGTCLKGTFTVTPENLPEEYKVGLFAESAVYPMFGRFSNGRPGRDSNDRDASVFGFGVKVIGVPGDKFDMQSLGSTKPKNANQDWNLATGQTFPIPSATIYREQRASGSSNLATAAFAIKHPVVAQALLASLKRINSHLEASYHSQTALHYGEDHVAKFSVVPCNGVENDISGAQAALRDKNYLAKDLATRVAADGACFVFRAQIRPSDENLTAANANWATKYPRDNPTKVWSGTVIPFVDVAKIEFPKQTQSANLQETCEALSINPGNTLQAFRPIESDTLMRSRFLSAYEGSVTKRAELNATTQAEPGPIENLNGWFNE